MDTILLAVAVVFGLAGVLLVVNAKRLADPDRAPAAMQFLHTPSRAVQAGVGLLVIAVIAVLGTIG